MLPSSSRLASPRSFVASWALAVTTTTNRRNITDQHGLTWLSRLTRARNRPGEAAPPTSLATLVLATLMEFPEPFASADLGPQACARAHSHLRQNPHLS